MDANAPVDGFDQSRAELFETLSHPARMKILTALGGGPMGFADLKRVAGIESSGNMQFHLGRLKGLVATVADGSYVLTDEGKDALRMMTVSSRTGDFIRVARRVFLDRKTWAVIAFSLAFGLTAIFLPIFQTFVLQPCNTGICLVAYVRAHVSLTYLLFGFGGVTLGSSYYFW